MFNLKEDPQEQHNLYHDPRYREIKVELLECLVKVRAQPRLSRQYRTLPAREGLKWDTNTGETWPLYPQDPSPWIEDAPQPEWRGRCNERG